MGGGALNIRGRDQFISVMNARNFLIDLGAAGLWCRSNRIGEAGENPFLKPFL